MNASERKRYNADLKERYDIDGVQPYDEALKRYNKVGAANADDAALMAGYCQHTLQLIAGAVSPKLVWEGAQKQGLTTSQLAKMDPRDIAELMWL